MNPPYKAGFLCGIVERRTAKEKPADKPPAAIFPADASSR